MEYNNRILIVDDSEAIQEDFRKILSPRVISGVQRLESIEDTLFGDDEDVELTSNVNPVSKTGYQLSFASQADTAIEMVRRSEEDDVPYAVIFTDVRMPPGLDGIQLVQKLLKLSPFTEIVIVTAYSDYSWEELSAKFGWTDRILILRKPFDGITIKQIASTLTRKWELGLQARHLAASMSVSLMSLERQVEERTVRLTEAYKELQHFAYIISHDLRSPLVSIRGFVSELRFDLEKVLQAVDVLLPNMDEPQQQALEQALRENIPEAMDFIDTSTTKMDRLIKGILKLARLGHRKFQFESLDLAQIFEQQLEVLAYSIEKGGIAVKIAGPLPKIVTDRQGLEQIVGNLLSNAVKFLRADVPGQIVVSAMELADGRVSFSIEDNGRGIGKGDMNSIFEIFQRGSVRDIPGEGMGLTFVKTLLQRLGGEVECNSEVGVGTSFTVYLPKDPPAATAIDLVGSSYFD